MGKHRLWCWLMVLNLRYLRLMVLLIFYSLKFLDESRVLQGQLTKLVGQVRWVALLLLNLDVRERERNLHISSWGPK